MSIDDDKRIIRELVENWAVWRDARLWDRFRTVWHADGRMMATWFQGSFDEAFARTDVRRHCRGEHVVAPRPITHIGGERSIGENGIDRLILCAQRRRTVLRREFLVELLDIDERIDDGAGLL